MSSDEPATGGYLSKDPAYRIIGEYAMASPDLIRWYEKPEGMSMAEFTASLPRPVPVAAGFEPCRVYWGSHGCDLERGHAERDGTPHDCGCCECGNHPDPDSGCVGREPYYGAETNFYGEDATPESVGRWGQVIP